MSGGGFNLSHGLAEVLPYVGGTGWVILIVYAVNVWLKKGQQRLDEKKQDQANDLAVEEHRDSLTIQLLGLAREEIKILKLDLERHRASDSHIQHFQEALTHIEAIILAENKADRAIAERAARAFLNRMKRLAEAAGTIHNQVQFLESKAAIAEREQDEEEAGQQ